MLLMLYTTDEKKLLYFLNLTTEISLYTEFLNSVCYVFITRAPGVNGSFTKDKTQYMM